MSKRHTDGNIKRDWGYMRDMASQNGLTLRYHNKKGEYPRTFELVIARTPVGTNCILKNLSVSDIENEGILSNGLTMEQTIIGNAIRSKK